MTLSKECTRRSRSARTIQRQTISVRVNRGGFSITAEGYFGVAGALVAVALILQAAPQLVALFGAH
jgi:hypothetical protein